ncbi:MAG: hypothetical protein ACTHJY_03200, partial [Rhizobiaceae bacterium]
PFSNEQRVWLDGLFAGLLSLEYGVTPLSREQAAALLPGGVDLASPSVSTQSRPTFRNFLNSARKSSRHISSSRSTGLENWASRLSIV